MFRLIWKKLVIRSVAPAARSLRLRGGEGQLQLRETELVLAASSTRPLESSSPRLLVRLPISLSAANPPPPPRYLRTSVGTGWRLGAERRRCDGNQLGVLPSPLTCGFCRLRRVVVTALPRVQGSLAAL